MENLEQETTSVSYSNKVTLIGYYGGDKTHCLSAWQSTCFDLEEYEVLLNSQYMNESYIDRLFEATSKTKKKTSLELLTFLAENEHHTPFEKSTLHFQVRADIATHIQFLKHRIGVSINTESARYKELLDKYYLPWDWISSDLNVTIDLSDLTVGKIYSTHLSDNGFTDIPADQENVLDALDWYARLGHELYHQACNALTPVLGRKRARESARYFLPYCKQVDFDVMFNFRSFMHFQDLRNSEHAQLEIKEIAEAMLHLVASLEDKPFKESLQAFGYYEEEDEDY